MRLLRAGDYRRMPWKNGGGETVEIAIFPPDAGLDTFEWRVSTATVATEGVFSSFEGIDRTLSVLKGKLRLAMDGGAPITLSVDDDPLAFAADIPVTGGPVGTPVVDLNVMTRRGSFSHTVERLHSMRGRVVPAFEGETLIHCLHGSVSIATAGRELSAAAGETLVACRTTPELTIREQQGVSYLIRIARLPA